MHDRTGIEAIEKLRESEEQFRLIAENLPGICWISDGAGELLWANREWHAMFDGTSAQDGDPRGICHPDDLPILRDLWRRMRAVGEVEAVQLRLRGQDNIYRPFLSKAVPVRDIAGQVVRWCGVQIDLSEQHAHDRRQTVLRAFHEQSRDVSDPDEILIVLSRILSEHLGIARLLYGEIDDKGNRTSDIFHAAGGVPQTDPEMRLCINHAFTELARLYDWGETRALEDNRILERTADDPVQRAADMMGVRASINVPIVKDGKPMAMIMVLDTDPRTWTRDEIELCEELADRSWAAIARARAETALQERERHQAFLIDWSDKIRGEASGKAIVAITLEWLARHLRTARTSYAECDETGRHFTVTGEWREERVTPILGNQFSLASVGAAVDREWMAGEMIRYDDVATDPRLEAAAVERYLGAQIRSFVSIPLVQGGLLHSALSVQHDEVRRWSEGEVQLMRDIAERTWVALERARVQAALERRERNQAFLLAWNDQVRRETSAHAIMQITLEWLGEYLGVTRATYSESDADGQVFTVLNEWRDGVSSNLGKTVRLGRLGDAVDSEWLSGDMVCYHDVTTDPRVEPAALAVYAETSVRAFISVPILQGGAMRSILSIHDRNPRQWGDDELRLMRDIAERAWVMLERAHAEAALQERERNQTFLLDWNDRVRRESSARGILGATLAALAEHLGAMRTNFAETAPNGRDLIVLQEWSNGQPGIVNQRYSPEDLGGKLAESHASGGPVRVDDIETDPRFDDGNRPLFRSLNIASVLTLPMMRGQRIVAVLSVQHDSPHRWSDSEVELVRDLADRTLAVLERAHSEERLAENEAQLSAFLENAPVAMHLKDENGRYIRVNPELARAVGVTPDELLGAHPEEVFPQRIAAEIVALEARGLAGEVASAEMAITEMEQDGHVLSMVFPITGAGVARTGGFTLDLTERKRAEAALAKSRETLYQTEKLTALGSLLAGVSHELNNPLSIVVAQAVMMERQSRGSELAERAQKIRKAADRCARIVQTFLAMARQKRPEREPVDLNAVAMAAYDLAEYGLKNDGIRATRDLAPSLPPISADSDQLHQIIINLIVNAQQALVEMGHPDRALTLRTSVGDAPDTVILEVADNGPGIPDEARRRVFEPFYTTKPQGQGTGVGLSFSQGLAEAHGGRLELVPSPRGACFRLTLPVDLQPVVTALPDEPEDEAETPARRALVVDDEQEIAESLADFLSIEGFTCDVAVGGAEAKVWLAQGSYDLIVSDLRMPGIDGPALHAWIADQRPDLVERVGFATGDTLGAAAARFLEEVKRPVLEKPFMPEGVQQFLQQMDLA